MSRYVLQILLVIACFLYIVMTGAFIGLANDYETIGHGLMPMIAVPAALLMAVMAFASYRLAFSQDTTEEQIEEQPQLVWPTINQHWE